MRSSNGCALRVISAAWLCLSLAACKRETADPAPAAGPSLAAPLPQVRPSLDPPVDSAEPLFVPPNIAAGERRPLILFLHGLGSSGKVAFEALQLQLLGERERLLIVAPDGNRDSRGRLFWDAHPACCNFDGRPVDDVARLGALLDRYRQRADVDPARIYAVGFSNGGFMAHRLGCKLADRLAAIVSIAGSGPVAGETCAAPGALGVLEIHGDSDEVVRYGGGTLFNRSAQPQHASAVETARFWAERLGCKGAPQAGKSLDLVETLPGEETRTENYAGCSAGAVALWTVQGGNHYIGSNRQFHEQVWRFLSQFSRR